MVMYVSAVRYISAVMVVVWNINHQAICSFVRRIVCFFVVVV